MDIIWYGRGCVALRSGVGTVVADPSIAIGSARLAALQPDIVTLSARRGAGEDLAALGGTPFVVDRPGEYEARGVFLIGIETVLSDRAGKDAQINTAYCIDVDDVTVCHLGRLNHPLNQSQVEALGDVHVLLLPIGQGDALSPAQAIEVVNQIEPSIVIPLYDPSQPTGSGGPMDRFLQEMGALEIEPRAMYRMADVTRLPEEPQVVLLTVAT